MPDDTAAVAKRIEQPVKASGDHVSGAAHKEVNAALAENPQIANDPAKVRELSAQLEQSGVLGKLILDDQAVKALSGGGTEITKDTLTTALNKSDTTPENKMLAQALLDRFAAIDASTNGGLSVPELRAWASAHDGSQLQAGVTRDSAGRITSSKSPDGSTVTYTYNADETSKNAPPARVTVTNKDGGITETFMRDPENGTYTRQKWSPLEPPLQGPPSPNGRPEQVSDFKVYDGTGGYSFRQADGSVVDNVLGSSQKTVPTLNEEALKYSAQQLHDAIDKKDKDAIRRILEPMTSDDRHLLEQVYHDLYNKQGPADTLRRDIKAKLDPADAARDIAILDRRATTTNDAGELDLQLTQLAKGDKNATLAIREILSTLNPEQIKQLDDDLKSRYGDKYPNGLQSALFENSKISDQEKEALKILAKGITNSSDGSPGRTVEDNIKLANMALGMKPPDLNLLGEALRGNEPSARKAREALQNDAAFLQRVGDTFGAQNPVARDFIQQGYISLTTIADANNKGYFGSSNRKNIELALQNATLEERQRYVHGREIANSGATPAADSQDAKDLRFYQLTHDALINVTRKQEPAPTDIVDPPKTNPPNLNPVDQLLYDRDHGASPQKALIDSEAMLADPEARARFWALYNGKEKDYFAHGGTKEDLERDKKLLEYLKDAADKSASRAITHTTGSGPLESLLVYGKLTAYQLANLEYPESFIQQRLKNETPQERDRDQRQINDLYKDYGIATNDQINRDITKWEDLLVRGGSLVTTLADNHKDTDRVLASIENMSRQDWARLNNPQLRDGFMKDIENALTTYGVDEATRAKAMELLKRKSEAKDYLSSLEVHRSILDSGKDSGTVIDNILNLSKEEQQKYINNSDDFQKKIADLIKNAKLDETQKLFVDHFLAELKKTGTLPTYETLNPVDKVLYDYATKADPYKTLQDLEVVLRDPALRKELDKDAWLHNTFSGGYTPHDQIKNKENAALAEVIRQVAGQLTNNAQRFESGYPATSRIIDQLLRDGKLDLDSKVYFKFPPEQLFPELAKLPKDQREEYFQQLKLTKEQRELFDAISGPPQNGNLQLEDRLRLFIIQRNTPPDGYGGRNGKYSDFESELRSLSPADLQKLKSEYAQKFHSDFDNDFLRTVDSKDYEKYTKLLTPQRGDGRQEYFDALGKLKRAETGYIPEGPDLNAQRALQLYAVALGDAQSGFQSLSPAEQEQYQKYFGEALQQLKDSQREFAEQLISLGEKAVMFGAGLLAIAASGGTLSPVVIAAIVAAGGALDGATRLAVLKAVQGENFDGSVSNVLGQFFEGFAKGSLDTFGAVTLPGAGKAAIEIAGSVTAKTVAALSRAGTITEDGISAFRTSLARLIERKGTSAVTQADIAAAARADLGLTEQQANELAQATLQETRAQGEQRVAQQTVQSLQRTARGERRPLINAFEEAEVQGYGMFPPPGGATPPRITVPEIDAAKTVAQLDDAASSAYLTALDAGDEATLAAIRAQVKAKFLELTANVESVTSIKEYVNIIGYGLERDAAVMDRFADLIAKDVSAHGLALAPGNAEYELIQTLLRNEAIPQFQREQIRTAILDGAKDIILRGGKVEDAELIARQFNLGSEVFSELRQAKAAYEALQLSPEKKRMLELYNEFKQYKNKPVDEKAFKSIVDEMGLELVSHDAPNHYAVFVKGSNPPQLVGYTWLTHTEGFRGFTRRATQQYFEYIEAYLGLRDPSTVRNMIPR